MGAFSCKNKMGFAMLKGPMDNPMQMFVNNKQKNTILTSKTDENVKNKRSTFEFVMNSYPDDSTCLPIMEAIEAINESSFLDMELKNKYKEFASFVVHLFFVFNANSWIQVYNVRYLIPEIVNDAQFYLWIIESLMVFRNKLKRTDTEGDAKMLAGFVLYDCIVQNTDGFNQRLLLEELVKILQGEIHLRKIKHEPGLSDRDVFMAEFIQNMPFSNCRMNGRVSESILAHLIEMYEQRVQQTNSRTWFLKRNSPENQIRVFPMVCEYDMDFQEGIPEALPILKELPQFNKWFYDWLCRVLSEWIFIHLLYGVPIHFARDLHRETRTWQTGSSSERDIPEYIQWSGFPYIEHPLANSELSAPMNCRLIAQKKLDVSDYLDLVRSTLLIHALRKLQKGLMLFWEFHMTAGYICQSNVLQYEFDHVRNTFDLMRLNKWGDTHKLIIHNELKVIHAKRDQLLEKFKRLSLDKSLRFLTEPFDER